MLPIFTCTFQACATYLYIAKQIKACEDHLLYFHFTNLNLPVFTCTFQARAKYLHVAKQMKAYEDHLYEAWREQVEAVLPSLLKRNLLVKPAIREASVVGDDAAQEKVEVEAGRCNNTESGVWRHCV